MSKEEIDNLEDYLRNYLPKIEPTIPITTFGSVDLEDLMDSIKHLKKVPTSYELLRENKRLRKELEEKDKIIKEIKNILINYKSEWVENDEVVKDINKFLEILERGKNGK